MCLARRAPLAGAADLTAPRIPPGQICVLGRLRLFFFTILMLIWAPRGVNLESFWDQYL